MIWTILYGPFANRRIFTKKNPDIDGEDFDIKKIDRGYGYIMIRHTQMNTKIP